MKIEVHRKGAGKSQVFYALEFKAGRPFESLEKISKSKRTVGSGSNTRNAVNDLRAKLGMPPVVTA